MKILVAEKIAASAVDVLREPGWTILTHDQLDGKLEKELETADALIVRSAVQANAALLEHAKQLRVIVARRRGRGQHRDGSRHPQGHRGHEYARRQRRRGRGTHSRSHCWPWPATSVAPTRPCTPESGKKIPPRHGVAREDAGRSWPGQIGIEVARRARAFGMEVVAHDPYVSASLAQTEKIRMGTVEEVYAAADYLSLHVGLTPQTVGMINEKSIAQMKKGVRLVNCARGELIVEADLAAAVTAGKVAGAALDVFEKEPPKGSPLVGLTNVLLTPHVAGSTNEAQDAVGVQIAQQVKEYLKHGVIQNAVNVPSVSHEEYEELEPYIALAERMGAFLSQATDGNVEGISLEYRGQLAEWKTDLVRNAAVMGILNRTLEEKGQRGECRVHCRKPRGLPSWKRAKAKGRGGAGNVLSVTLRTKSTERGRQRRSPPREVTAPSQRRCDRHRSAAGKDLLYLRNKTCPALSDR